MATNRNMARAPMMAQRYSVDIPSPKIKNSKDIDTVNLKGHKIDFFWGQILFLYFNRLQCFSNTFPAINQILGVSRRVISKIQTYVKKVRVMFLIFRWFDVQVKVLFHAIFFYLLIRFEPKNSSQCFSFLSIKNLNQKCPGLRFKSK